MKIIDKKVRHELKRKAKKTLSKINDEPQRILDKRMKKEFYVMAKESMRESNLKKQYKNIA